MKSHYKPYFGLLMSKLYAPSIETKKREQCLLKTCTKGSLLWTILTRKANRYLVKSKTLTIYNSSSKMSELLLQILTGKETTISVDSKIRKKYLNFDWQVSTESILKGKIEKIENPFNPNKKTNNR